MSANNKKDVTKNGWTLAELQATASAITPPGADTDIPEEDRFRAGVTKLISLRSLQGTPETAPAIFLLTNGVTASPAGWPRTPMLDNGLTSLGGKIWLVNAPVVSGFSTACITLDDDEIFQLVTGELQLGNQPAIIFDPRTPEPVLRYYPTGLISADNYAPIHLRSGPLSLDELLSEVEKIYEQHLITPESQSDAGKLWKKSSHCWAAENAEKVVQLYLKVGLSRAYPNCTIREEQTQVSGRIDLEIEEKVAANPSQFQRYAILELKVLRSRGATGKSYTETANLDCVKKGVEQASAYREERSALASALCCFDLRSTDGADACFNHVKTLAATLKVALRRWYVYSSSHLYRTATAITRTTN